MSLHQNATPHTGTAWLSAEDYREEMAHVTEGQPVGRNPRMHFKCPHCHSAAAVRSSRELTPLLRESYYQCSNVVCGHTFKVMLEVVKTISPAAHPDPVIAAQLQNRATRQQAPISPPLSPLPPNAITRHHFAQMEAVARLEQARQQLGTPYRPPTE